VDRSENMRRIRSKGMRPEMTVRSLVHRMDYRFRLHKKELLGKPDLTFVSLHKVIFVHGCFWHSHKGCKTAHMPKSNLSYWGPKLERNRTRDAASIAALKREGWKTLVIWECETHSESTLQKRIKTFLGGNAASRRAA
jgi:DNA mismatch endonuclease (patch repair protein)